MTDKQIQTGFITRGHLLGVKSKPWKNDSTKFSHQLALQVSSPNGFGGFNTESVLLNIPGSELPKFQELVTKYQNQLIDVPFSFTLKNYGDRSWIESFIPQGSTILPVADSVPSLKKVS